MSERTKVKIPAYANIDDAYDKLHELQMGAGASSPEISLATRMAKELLPGMREASVISREYVIGDGDLDTIPGRAYDAAAVGMIIGRMVAFNIIVNSMPPAIARAMSEHLEAMATKNFQPSLEEAIVKFEAVIAECTARQN